MTSARIIWAMGARFNLTRTSGGGATSLPIEASGVGTLKILQIKQWCEVVHDGTTWVLTQFGVVVIRSRDANRSIRILS